MQEDAIADPLQSEPEVRFCNPLPLVQPRLCEQCHQWIQQAGDAIRQWQAAHDGQLPRFGDDPDECEFAKLRAVECVATLLAQPLWTPDERWEVATFIPVAFRHEAFREWIIAYRHQINWALNTTASVFTTDHPSPYQNQRSR